MSGFAPLADAAAAFGAYPGRWFFCGGTALDLFMGRPLRVRHDIDIGVLRREQRLLWQHFAAGPVFYIDPSLKRRIPWNGAPLSLPAHELYIGEGQYALEVLLNESDGDFWVYRRDDRLRLPLEKAVLTAAAGLPYLAPEIVLLFKSKHMRPQDEADFGFVKQSLPPDAKDWLRAALALTAPDHAWLAVLGK